MCLVSSSFIIQWDLFTISSALYTDWTAFQGKGSTKVRENKYKYEYKNKKA